MHAGDVVRITFPRKEMKYMAGQYIFICIPEISLFQWHPFSLSSAPHQEDVMIHIRALGNWTKHLHSICHIDTDRPMKMYWDGPFGNPKIEVWGERYKSFILISGEFHLFSKRIRIMHYSHVF